MMTSPVYSAFHPKPPGVSKKSKEALARGLKLMYMSGMDFGSQEDDNPSWWNTNLENMYRCQVAGYRDENHYREKRHLKEVEKWKHSGLIKKLIRWDGMYYYFGEGRECPKLKSADVKMAFLRETVIFENSPYTDGTLQWAPVLSKMTQKINDACEEVINSSSRPKERTVKKEIKCFPDDNIKIESKRKRRRIKRSSNVIAKYKSRKPTSKRHATMKKDGHSMLSRTGSVKINDTSEILRQNSAELKTVNTRRNFTNLGASFDRATFAPETRRVEKKPKNKTKKAYSDATIITYKKQMSKVPSSLLIDTVIGDRKATPKEGNTQSFCKKKNMEVRDQIAYKNIYISEVNTKHSKQNNISALKNNVRNTVSHLELDNEFKRIYESELYIPNSHVGNLNDPWSSGVLHKPPIGRKQRHKSTGYGTAHSTQFAPLYTNEPLTSTTFLHQLQLSKINKWEADPLGPGHNENPGRIISTPQREISKIDFTPITGVANAKTHVPRTENQKCSAIVVPNLTDYIKTEHPKFDLETYNLRDATLPINTNCKSLDKNLFDPPRHEVSSNTYIPQADAVQRNIEHRRDPQLLEPKFCNMPVSADSMKSVIRSEICKFRDLRKEYDLRIRNRTVKNITVIVPKQYLPKTESKTRTSDSLKQKQMETPVRKSSMQLKPASSDITNERRLVDIEADYKINNINLGNVYARPKSRSVRNCLVKSKALEISAGTVAPNNSFINMSDDPCSTNTKCQK